MDKFESTDLLNRIKAVLLEFPEYWEGEALLKNKLIDDLRAYKPSIIKSLLSEQLIKDTYSLDLDGITIFKVEDFISMLRYKNYWEDSFTKYSNEIGLTSEGKYLKYNSDVVLDFPHKDGVLEGGMTKEDIEKEEVFYHNVLAKEEIDTLFAPKILSNVKKYDTDGKHNITDFNESDNLIIKGNNLIALHTLKKQYAGKVKLIYIDPPYNTGGDSFKYNDRFNHSTWLTFMKNRLEIARDFLSNEGSVWINIGDDEGHHLKLLCDDIFGRNNFVSSIVWRSSDNSNNDAKRFSQDHNYILVYSKQENWLPNKIERSKEQSRHYKNPDDDPRGPWFDGNPVSSPNPRPNLRYNIIAPNGNVIRPPSNGWRWSEEILKSKIEDGEIRFNETFTNIKRRTYQYEQNEVPASTLWVNLKETGHNRQAKYEQKRLFPDLDKENWFSTPKPEKLIKKILDIGTDKGDLILDFFLGSGTTQAVAHKMNRQYIGIEQMGYINEISVPRLQKVIEGEQGGISEDVEWQGGESFVYAELHSLNQQFVQSIQSVASDMKLRQVINQMKKEAFLDFKVNIDRITNDDEGFVNLSLEEKKDVLIQALDANQMYLNYSEIDDEEYGISEEVKQFNRSFYEDGEA